MSSLKECCNHCVLHIVFYCSSSLLAKNSVLCYSSDPGLLQSCATDKVSDLFSHSKSKWPVGTRLRPNECHCQTVWCHDNFFVPTHNRKCPFAWSSNMDMLQPEKSRHEAHKLEIFRFSRDRWRGPEFGLV